MVNAFIEDTTKDESLASIGCTAKCAMAFAGFHRHNDVSDISVCDMELTPGYLIT